MMWFVLVALAIIGWGLCPDATRAEVVINEVMANPAESENDCEWVELYNAGSSPVDIGQWTFDGYPISDTALFVPALDFLVIVRELIDGDDGDSLSFEAVWGNGSGVWGDDPSEGYRAINGAMSLSNGQDSVVLAVPGGARQVFIWPSTEEGISWEKIDPVGGDDPANWTLSKNLLGSTPGARNSVCTLPYDISICSNDISFSPSSPIQGDDVEISAFVHNRGKLPAQTVETIVFVDQDGDSVHDPEEEIGVYTVTIDPGDSAWISTVLRDVAAGSHRVFVRADFSLDEDLTNNQAMRVVYVRSAEGGVIINEVMANAIDEKSGEFFELFNLGQESVSVGRWQFTDGDALDVIVPWNPSIHGSIVDDDAVVGSSTIHPEGFALVLDPDYAAAESTQVYDLPPGTLVLTVEDATLGNGLTTTDPVTLYDSSGTAQQNVIDTYGTPLASDDPRECDDDEEDGIPFNPGNGISVERVDPHGPDDELNWLTSKSTLGCTPGARNSVSRAPYDVSLREGNISFDPRFPRAGDGVSISVHVVNQGINSIEAGEVQVVIFDDLDLDSTSDQGEVIDTEIIVVAISPGDSTTVSATLEEATSGRHAIFARADYPPDQDIADNLARRELLVSFPRTVVVINEIMYDPLVGPEWVEIYNSDSREIDLRGWTIEDSDSSSRAVISQRSAIISPREYAVIVDDTADFRLSFPSVSPLILQPDGGFPLLIGNQQFQKLL